ncbi:MAG: hypothetical protein SFX19_10550 [Alphaproteobacteria bacterium]|nr:hypothetical protein [Alphaproteobacteria bacterium]
MTINTNYGLLNSGYYSLSQSTGASVAASSKNTAQATGASTAAGESLSAYLLDLSPEAKDYLNSTLVSSTANSFTLSQSQQKQIDAILQKYKDAPYTQETFEQIQADLQQAGLSPDQLAAQQQAKDFNPTQALIDALNGKEKNADELLPGNDSAQYDTQKNNFLDGVIEAFKKIAAPVDTE